MKTIEILLVEDNEADVFLMREIFQESKHKNNISIAANGVAGFPQQEGPVQ